MQPQLSLFSIDHEREDRHALDDLFLRSLAYRRSDEYMQMLEWVARFPLYRPFNRLLLYQQKPDLTFAATPYQWEHLFGRTVKPESRPLVILKPFAPVQFVYDVVDTEGAPLPDGLVAMFAARGAFSLDIWNRTCANLPRDKIFYREADLDIAHAGSMLRCQGPASRSVRAAPDWARYVLTLRKDADPATKYATLVHELAHLYCGHLGGDHEGDWEDRRHVPHEEMEFEAESVAYLVCRHAGIDSSSQKYLAQFATDNGLVPPIGITVVLKAAGRIEEMGEKMLPERKEKKTQ